MRDYKVYYERMAINVKEKTDFLIEEIDNNRAIKVIDYGFGDGTTTEFLASLFPNLKIYGLEKDIFIDKLKEENTFENIFYIKETKMKEVV